ncbi:MAG: hypothetical protein HY900_20720 [Deltaproteobacteria bacterium]|nr:hypothetical protein [Deltaproteobacteria bacterium]
MIREVLPGGGSAAEPDRERRVADLSRLYFSAHTERRAGEEGNPAPTAGATLFSVALWNVTGADGEVFLDWIGHRLRRRGLPLLQAWAKGPRFRIGAAAPGELLTGSELAGRIGSPGELGMVILRFDASSGDEAFSLLRACDAAAILTDGRVGSMAGAFRVLKGASSAEGEPGPAVLYRSTTGDLWDQIAPLRLAEAAIRFLHRRVPLWYAAGPEGAANRLQALAERRLKRAAPAGSNRLRQVLERS